jgi:hypothetical protein
VSADREVTRIVRSWLEKGVTALPDRVLDNVLDQVPATRQRRPWWPAWRLPYMSMQIRIALAAAALVVVAGGAYIFSGRNASQVGGPSPSPSAFPGPTPIDTATWVRITSLPFGISSEIPPDWHDTYRPAVSVAHSPIPWIYGGGAPETSGSDEFGDLYGAQRFSVASQPIPSGVDQATWFATNFGGQILGSCGPLGMSDFTPTTLAGLPAFERDALDVHGCGYAFVVAFDGGRAYELSYHPAWLFGDRGLLAAWLSTVRLTPDNAVDPAPTDTPGGH